MPAQSQGRTAYLVLGVPRSGTSAISHFLNNCGIDFGDPAKFLDTQIHRHNPIFFELGWVNDINDRIIGALGSRYKDTFLPLEADYNRDVLDNLKRELAKSIAAEWPGSLCIGIKDPRFCFTLPIWWQTLSEMNYALRLVWSLRSAAATIESNCKLQPGWPKARMGNFWLQSTLAARYFSRDCPTLFLDYDRLMSEPAAFAEDAIAELRLNAVDAAATVRHVAEANHHQRETGSTGFALIDRVDSELRAGTLDPGFYLLYRDVASLFIDDDYVRHLEATLHREREESQVLAARQSACIEKWNQEFHKQQQSYTACLEARDDRIRKLSGELRRERERASAPAIADEVRPRKAG